MSCCKKDVQVKIKMASDCGDLFPIQAYQGDAGVDIKSKEDCIIAPQTRKLIKTGIHMAIPHGFEAQIRPRSGLALKNGITIVNTPGTIDSEYRGEVGVVILNTDKNQDFHIQRGDRIAQLVIQKLPQVIFENVEELEDSTRGDKGFGSSGVK